MITKLQYETCRKDFISGQKGNLHFKQKIIITKVTTLTYPLKALQMHGF